MSIKQRVCLGLSSLSFLFFLAMLVLESDKMHPFFFFLETDSFEGCMFFAFVLMLTMLYCAVFAYHRWAARVLRVLACLLLVLLLALPGYSLFRPLTTAAPSTTYYILRGDDGECIIEREGECWASYCTTRAERKWIFFAVPYEHYHHAMRTG